MLKKSLGIEPDDFVFIFVGRLVGDKGINEKVATDFWDCTKDIMAAHFKNTNNKQALVDGINNAGEQLKKHFPYESDDTNELTNEISKG